VNLLQLSEVKELILNLNSLKTDVSVV